MTNKRSIDNIPEANKVLAWKLGEGYVPTAIVVASAVTLGVMGGVGIDFVKTLYQEGMNLLAQNPGALTLTDIFKHTLNNFRTMVDLGVCGLTTGILMLNILAAHTFRKISQSIMRQNINDGQVKLMLDQSLKQEDFDENSLGHAVYTALFPRFARAVRARERDHK